VYVHDSIHPTTLLFVLQCDIKPKVLSVTFLHDGYLTNTRKNSFWHCDVMVSKLICLPVRWWQCTM